MKWRVYCKDNCIRKKLSLSAKKLRRSRILHWNFLKQRNKTIEHNLSWCLYTFQNLFVKQKTRACNLYLNYFKNWSSDLRQRKKKGINTSLINVALLIFSFILVQMMSLERYLFQRNWQNDNRLSHSLYLICNKMALNLYND